MNQEDRDDAIGQLRAILYQDYNNGCLTTLSDIKAIVHHFSVKHEKSFWQIQSLFATALKTYDDPLGQ